MARLAGKVAFITGGGGGIGRATAERFAEEGAKVVIAEIDDARGKAAEESARARGKNSGGDALFIHCDIREQAKVEAAMAETVKRFGKLNVLHNNAGGSSPQDGPVTDRVGRRVLARDQARSLRHVPLLADRHPAHRQGGRRLDHQHDVDAGAQRRAGARLLYRRERRDRLDDALDGGRIRAAENPRQCDRAVGRRCPTA